MFLSIVIPTYASQRFIAVTLDAIEAYRERSGAELEVVIVDDGSPDSTFDVLTARAARATPPLLVVQLFRNRGQFRALMAGLEHASGQYVITFDDDLEYAADEIDKLLEPFRSEQGQWDVVIGVAPTRERSWMRNFGSWAVNELNTRMFNKPRHLRSSSFRAMTREFTRNLVQYRTATPVIGPLILNATRRIKNVEVVHQVGLRKSNYSRWGLIRTLYDNVVNYSELPLRYIARLGVLVSVLSGSTACFIVFQFITGLPWPIRAPGWTSLIVTMMFFSGVLLFSVGMLGEYVFRIMREVNGAPNYQVRSVTRSPGLIAADLHVPSARSAVARLS